MSRGNKKSIVYGLILSGGKSSRMGFDKSTISYHGKPQPEYLAGILDNFCDEVFISGKNYTPTPHGLTLLVDQFDIESPLNGIMTAFAHNPRVAWLTVPVDMPMIDHRNIKFLFDNRSNESDATCFFDSEGKKPEPLVAIWEATCHEKLVTFYKEGNISPRLFLETHHTRMLVPPRANFHLNINTTEELDRFRDGDR